MRTKEGRPEVGKAWEPLYCLRERTNRGQTRTRSVIIVKRRDISHWIVGRRVEEREGKDLREGRELERRIRLIRQRKLIQVSTMLAT